MTANLYGNYDRSDVQDRLHGDLAHFARKHGVIPTVVRMHPDLLPPNVCHIVVKGERGEIHTVRRVGDERQMKGTSLIAREEE